VAQKILCSIAEYAQARINAYTEWSTNKSVNEKVSHLVNDCLNNPLYANDVTAEKQYTLEQLIALVLERGKKEEIV
jgi:hypothetical protein